MPYRLSRFTQTAYNESFDTFLTSIKTDDWIIHSNVQPMELLALAIIVGISGGLAARLTPRKN